MENQNTKLLVAAALGAVSGLLLGSYLFGSDEKKGKLSDQLDALNKIVKELEEVETDEAKSMKEKVLKLIKSVEKGLAEADG